ncbi:hypothetical protein G7046_g9987 [Stylonectria norvegica]|nr:hypothetical protein G7046_g9987 [Stylonectria norvegica]
MVSIKSLFQVVLVIAGAVAATAAPSASPTLSSVPYMPRIPSAAKHHHARRVTTLTGVPYMPRIPSAAKHHQVLRVRAQVDVDPSMVVQTTCLDATETIAFHDETVAQLNICGGMAGASDKCKGAPKTTVGLAGTARFTVTAVDDGATVTISRDRWVRCVQAARAECPTGSLAATCLGGGSTGDVTFRLESTENLEL